MPSLGPVAAPASADDRSDCNGAKSDAAIGGCTRVIRSGKSTGRDLAVVFYARGRSYRLMGDNDRAIADYDESIKLNSGYAPAFLGRGNAWKSKGDPDRAIADFSQAIRLDQKFTSAYFNRGDVYDDKGDTTRALADLNAAIRLDPNDADAYILRGVLWKKKSDVDRAIRDYSEAIRLDPNRRRPISIDRSRSTTRAKPPMPLPTSIKPCGSIRASCAPTTSVGRFTARTTTSTAPVRTTRWC